MMNNPVKIIKLSEQNYYNFRSGMTKIFRIIFSDPPYFENFSKQEAQEIIDELVFCKDAVCCISLYNDQLIGFSGGFNVVENKKIFEIVKNKIPNINWHKFLYLAELAVVGKHRRKGYGTALTEEFLKIARDEIKCKSIVVRTQAQGSNAKRIFERLGFEMIDGLIQPVETWVGDNFNRRKKIQKRVFLLKNFA